MSIQISGSVAIDTIMVFEGRFRDHILADQVHMLNVAFLTPRMRQERGGCAANIAFGLRQLGQPAAILGSIGQDGVAYRDSLADLGIDMSEVHLIEDAYTAQAFITTDLDDNQITAFHPGAMTEAHRAQIRAATAGQPAFGIVSPNGRQAMIDHAAGFAAAGIPFIFDPGQAMPMFDGPALLGMVRQATWITVNDYESEMLCRTTGHRLEELLGLLQSHPQGGIVVTKGAEGAELLMQSGERVKIPALKIEKAVDPTGCGDSFRSGLLTGLLQGEGLAVGAAIGSVMGGLKIQTRGAQNYRLTRENFTAAWQSIGYPAECPADRLGLSA